MRVAGAPGGGPWFVFVDGQQQGPYQTIGDDSLAIALRARRITSAGGNARNR